SPDGFSQKRSPFVSAANKCAGAVVRSPEQDRATHAVMPIANAAGMIFFLFMAPPREICSGMIGCVSHDGAPNAIILLRFRGASEERQRQSFSRRGENCLACTKIHAYDDHRWQNSIISIMDRGTTWPKIATLR
ncbi:MAG TPA: hypothetical protein PLE73_02020, partial [Spirochaetota bacterium]|nr:hypothetical protein [Spirochaetota bacterium]